MRIALAQINTVVGDVDANLAAIRESIRRARLESASLVAFPELTLTGYPLLDLVHHQPLLERQRAALDELARASDDLSVVVGFVDFDPDRVGSNGRPIVYNAAAVLRHGSILGVHHKVLLPEYDVFFEQRYFSRGRQGLVVDLDGLRVGVQVCEDLWDLHYETKVTLDQARAGARLIINLSASPFNLGKGQSRRQLIQRHVRQAGCPLLFVNQVGGEDGYEGELVFDGDSLAYDRAGSLVGRGKLFEEDLVLVDLDEEGHGAVVSDREFDEDLEALGALVLGVREYARRTGFRKALVGLSGGVDSALVAVVAARALGAENVLGVSMPSRYSSDHSREDARELARNLGLEFRTIPIEKVHQAYLETLADSFEGTKPDVTEENLQARARGAILMALSNKTGALLLSTGNKTEVALGYCTLYGDMNGGLMVIADVSKPRVYAICRHINREAGREVIPRRTILKPPSAELKEDQVDPFDYDVVGPLTDLLVEQELTVEQCVARGYPRELAERLLRMIRVSEYKRRQAAPGIRITKRAFGVGRRHPIA